MITLYHDLKSYSSQKVQIYLNEKGIQWKSHPIDLLKQEHILDEAYKTIHPRGIVPALKDGNTIVCNSTEIMEYVSKKFLSQTDVFFDSHKFTAIHEFCKNDELLHDPHIRTLSYFYLWMSTERSSEEKSHLLALAAKHPDKARGEFLAKAIQGKITSEQINRANQVITRALQDMESKFADSQSDFIFGKEYSMADAVCTVRLFRFGRLNIKIELLKDQYPFTEAFYTRVKQRRSFGELI
jgi:glutathione S-transferase